MYNARIRQNISKYQHKFKRFSVMIPIEYDEKVKQAADGESRQKYIWGLILQDMKNQGII